MKRFPHYLFGSTSRTTSRTASRAASRAARATENAAAAASLAHGRTRTASRTTIRRNSCPAFCPPIDEKEQEQEDGDGDEGVRDSMRGFPRLKRVPSGAFLLSELSDEGAGGGEGEGGGTKEEGKCGYNAASMASAVAHSITYMQDTV